MSDREGSELRAIVVDVEGTTTELAFVHDVLFPIARRQMAEFVASRGEESPWREALARLREALSAQSGRAVTVAELIDHLHRMIDEDRKDTDLKLLQGGIWRQAFADGLRAHVYSDVPPALARWQARGLHVAVFSSGSVEAQRLLFAHSQAGDLTQYFAGFFDTTSGPKRDPEAYRRIARALDVAPSTVMFLSDTPAELDAARQAGMTAVHVVRPGTAPSGERWVVTRFDEVDALSTR